MNFAGSQGQAGPTDLDQQPGFVLNGDFPPSNHHRSANLNGRGCARGFTHVATRCGHQSESPGLRELPSDASALESFRISVAWRQSGRRDSVESLVRNLAHRQTAQLAGRSRPGAGLRPRFAQARRCGAVLYDPARAGVTGIVLPRMWGTSA